MCVNASGSVCVCDNGCAAVYTFLKYMGAASFLLWVAVTRKAKIEAFYTAKSCSACYSQSQQHPELIYEFGVCSVQYITNATGTNVRSRLS